jgi:hypothetical protein
MIVFAASAFLAGLLESLRTAHGAALMRVAALAAPVSAIWLLCFGLHEGGARVLSGIIVGLLAAEAGALLGLVLVFQAEARRRAHAPAR